MLDKLKSIIESNRFERFIIALVLVNAITLGLDTVPEITANFGEALATIDHLLLLIFSAELLARLVVYRERFFNDPWRIFDLLVVGIAWLPSTGNLSVLRALRILRVFRMAGMVPSLRRVVGGLVLALPGMGSATVLLGLIFYVFAVMATKLFGEAFPIFFGTIPATFFTLFQIMTLEGWSGEIVRPVMEVYPLAWLYFIPFILCTTFTVLNLFIGIIVSAMEAETHEQAEEGPSAAEYRALAEEMRALRSEIASLRGGQAAE